VAGPRLLRSLRAELLRQRRQRNRGPEGTHRQARLPQRRRPGHLVGPRRDRGVADASHALAFVPRLWRHGLPRRDPRLRLSGRPPRAGHGGPPARDRG